MRARWLVAIGVGVLLVLIATALVVVNQGPRHPLTLQVNRVGEDREPAEATIEPAALAAEQPALAAAFEEARANGRALISNGEAVEAACDYLESIVRSCSGRFEYRGQVYQTALVAI